MFLKVYGMANLHTYACIYFHTDKLFGDSREYIHFFIRQTNYNKKQIIFLSKIQNARWWIQNIKIVDEHIHIIFCYKMLYFSPVISLPFSVFFPTNFMLSLGDNISALMQDPSWSHCMSYDRNYFVCLCGWQYFSQCTFVDILHPFAQLRLCSCGNSYN